MLSVMLTLVLGMLDLSMMVFRYNMLSEAARQGTREAMVHGMLAPPRRTAWGPATYRGTAGDGHEITKPIEGALAGMDPQSVAVVVTWLDGSNEEQRRVQFRLTATHRPILISLFSNAEITLSATSTMLIAH